MKLILKGGKLPEPAAGFQKEFLKLTYFDELNVDPRRLIDFYMDNDPKTPEAKELHKAQKVYFRQLLAYAIAWVDKAKR